MTREEQIIERAKHEDSDSYFGFVAGAKWADENPDKEKKLNQAFEHANELDIRWQLEEKLQIAKEALELIIERMERANLSGRS